MIYHCGVLSLQHHSSWVKSGDWSLVTFLSGITAFKRHSGYSITIARSSLLRLYVLAKNYLLGSLNWLTEDELREALETDNPSLTNSLLTSLIFVVVPAIATPE